MCVYVNSGCNVGPYLVAEKMAQLPLQFGPGSINRVLREAVQACIDCASKEKAVFDMIKEGQGRVICTG